MALINLTRWFKELINTLLCKIYWCLDLYPYKILPNQSYVQLIEFDELNTSDRYSIVRRSNNTPEETFNNLGVLREDAITTKQVPNLSMNLLGGLFKIDHIKYRQLAPGDRAWNGSKVLLLDYWNKYQKLKGSAPILFYINKLHNKTFPYTHPSKDEAKKMKAAGIESNKNEVGYQFYGHTKIVHSPTMLNYWHVEFKMYKADGSEIKKTEAEWQKLASGFALGQILSMAAIDGRFNAEIEIISMKHYIQAS